jgi:hypothetical protein
MPEEPIKIRIEPRGAAVPRRKSRQAATWIVLASAAGMLLAAVALIASRGSSSRSTANRIDAAPPASQSREAPVQPVAEAPATDATTAEQVVNDPKGDLLWASPTAGKTLSLAYIPAGTQCLIHLRPALLATHPEGERVLAALGPWGQSILAQLNSTLKVDLVEINSLLVAVIVTPDGKLDASLRAELATPLTHDALAASFPSSQLAKNREHTYRVVNDRAYIISPSDGKTLIVCPTSLAAELIDSAGETPPLVRDIESLAKHADADRAATVLVAPKFLEAGGDELLVAEAAPLRDALHWLLGIDATAVALSAHWDENFFVELRATPALNMPRRRLAAKLREQIAEAPEAIEESILASPWHPHGRKVLARFPGMMRSLSRYTRAVEDDRQALVRAYLPPMAGHNLLMAAELLLTQPRTGEVAAATGPSTPAKPVTLEDRLAKVTSLSFPKDSLERALELLAEDAGVEITIQGADLQLDGITKNQSLTLDLSDRPVHEILLEILLKANPDRTATGPADVRQKLIYTIEPGQAGGPGRIIVTTRTAAEKRGDRLPDVFLPQQR